MPYLDVHWREWGITFYYCWIETLYLHTNVHAASFSGSAQPPSQCQTSTASWPCYRVLVISSVMPRPDRALKTTVWCPRAWPFPTVSNVTLRWPITDQLVLSSSILPRVNHAVIVWQPRGWPLYCLNLVYNVYILFKHVVIGQPETWINLMNISNRTHSIVQSIRATSER